MRPDPWRIPWPDRFGEWWQRSFPNLGPRLANLESRIAAADVDLQRVDRPVFIGGLARSGSTMLLEWLSAMPGFASHRYADFPLLWTPYWWNSLRARLPKTAVEPVERAHRDRIRVTRESPEAFEEPIWAHFLRARGDTGTDVLEADARLPRFEPVFRAHLAKLVAARDASRYVGKGNANTVRIAYLARLFPDAQFVVPIRAPLAQVASLLKQDRLYADAPARTLRHIEARGHHEFGPRQRIVRVDPDMAATIADLRRSDRAADAWLLQWMSVYAHVEALRTDPLLSSRIHVVAYEPLCAEPALLLESLLRILEAPRLDEAIALTRRDWVPRFSAADTAPLAESAVDTDRLATALALHARMLAPVPTMVGGNDRG
jgi:hypothetical protein